MEKDETRNKVQSIMPHRKSPLYAVKFLKTPNPQKKNPEKQWKRQVWRHSPNHFESTKKVTELMKQVDVM